MFQRAFEHRSGRVISLCRLVLATVFFLVMWIDPGQPAQHAAYAYPFVGMYVLLSAAHLAVTWNSWWFDYCLARWAHAVDIFVFTVAVYLTEAFSSNFTSPFFTFFAFLLFSASVRWGWRITAMTAGVATALYAFAGLLSLQVGMVDFDPYRFGRRAAYLLIMSMVLIWFGVNQQGRARAVLRPGQLEESEEADGPPIKALVEYVAERSGASRVLFVWWEHEEPWVKICDYSLGKVREQQFGPAELENVLSERAVSEPFIFDTKQGRALALSSNEALRVVSIPQPIDPSFAARFEIDNGLHIPIASRAFGGEMFVLGIEGLALDDLRLAQGLADDISNALDSFSMKCFDEEAAVTRAKLTIARDLHDSVVQVLAGASFRLEGLRSWTKAGRDPDAEILTIQRALANEQRSLRSFIAQLRSGRGSSRPVNTRESLATLVSELARQWAIRCTFSAPEEELVEPAWYDHELQQLVREMVANAVRHGKSSSVELSLQWDDDQVKMTVSDDGDGFPMKGQFDDRQLRQQKVRPWSLHERLQSMGGTLSLFSSGGGSRLTISLPRGEER